MALSAMLTALSVASSATIAASPARVEKLQPISAYLMDETAEVRLARSAAPPAIGKDATVLVLTPTGYRVAETGTNGFVCYVARSFTSAPDWPERWDPRIRAASCDNPQAARTITPVLRLRTALILSGRTDAEVLRSVKRAFVTKQIPYLGAGAMCFMMSKQSFLSAEQEQNMSHVMFYIPFVDGMAWGANEPHSPVMGGNYWFAAPGDAAQKAELPPLAVMLIPAANWSDGSPAMHQSS